MVANALAENSVHLLQRTAHSEYHFVRIAHLVCRYFDEYMKFSNSLFSTKKKKLLALSVSLSSSMRAVTNSRAGMLMKLSSLPSSSLFMLLSSKWMCVCVCVHTQNLWRNSIFCHFRLYFECDDWIYGNERVGRYLNALNLQLKAASSPLLFVAIFFSLSLTLTVFVLLSVSCSHWILVLFWFLSFRLGYFKR